MILNFSTEDKTFQLKVSKNDRISYIKKLISKRIKQNHNNIVLRIDDVTLEDYNRLKHYDILDFDDVYIYEEKPDNPITLDTKPFVIFITAVVIATSLMSYGVCRNYA